MFSITERSRTEVTYEEVYYPTSVYTESTVKVYNYAFFLMPGMRFQKEDNKAFQISLAGVINVHQGKTNSFPVPMCSWLFKL